jgi:HlyD family secretion protein
MNGTQVRTFGTRSLHKSARSGVLSVARNVGAAFILLAGVIGCSRPDTDRVQGYVEGEFVYMASPLAGTLETLYVQRGAQAGAGDQLFALESAPENAARDEADRRLAQGRANLEDIKKGKRPTEIEALEAQLRQAKAALILSERQLTREEDVARSNASARQDLDRARAARDQDRQRVAQLEAELETARLGGRADQIAAAAANVRALEASLAKAEWDLAQKRRSAPQAGLIFDTLFREGEWVAAGRPVVALLPPQNIKVRAFVAESRVGSIKVGDSVRVTVDGVKEPHAGKVSYISTKAEFTPPVIYSRENRSKLVFLIEAAFDAETAARLHPGQPVDVRFE